MSFSLLDRYAEKNFEPAKLDAHQNIPSFEGIINRVFKSKYSFIWAFLNNGN